MSQPFATQFMRSLSLKRDEIPCFSAYPFDIPAVRNLDVLDFHPSVTFLVGDNGTGKSTLLEAIAVGFGFNPEGGSHSFKFSTRESHSPLHAYLRLVKGIRRPKTGFFLRAESYFNVATEIERLDDDPLGGPPIIDSFGGVSLHEMSHGESFWALLIHKFHGQGLYILDEPEAALSPSRQLSALSRVHELVKDGSQFIIATHSPILMAYPNARIFLFGDDAIREVRYEETEHYTVTRDFLERRETMLRELLQSPQMELDEIDEK
ncbi:MAG: AAA family ATPase [Candidatus Hydrogenedentes bacterium]|nr:AAA family ATPase [Candidatus Hydrogenedentota bacterium]